MTNADGNFSPEWKSIFAGFLTFHGVPRINILLFEILNSLLEQEEEISNACSTATQERPNDTYSGVTFLDL